MGHCNNGSWETSVVTHLTAVDVAAAVGASKMAPMAAKMSPPLLPADDDEELRVTSGGTAAASLAAGRLGCASILGSPPPFPAAPPLLLLLLPAAAAGVLVGTATSPSPAREREMTEPVSAKRVSPAVSSSSSPWPPRMKVPNGSQIQLT